MKKAMILGLIGAMTLTMSSCGNSASQDAYGNVSIEQEGALREGSADVVQADQNIDPNLGQENDANQVSEEEPTVEAGEQDDTDGALESDEALDSDEVKNTGQEDETLELASLTIDYGLDVLLEEEGERVEDEQLMASFDDMMHSLYYNYFFTPSLNQETGLIEASNMELFALSYIMQHDYEGLAFDYSTYELRIPREQVIETVAKFFRRDLDVHGSYEDFKVTYDEAKECYTVIIEDDQWEVNLTLNEVRRLNETTYRVIYDLPRKTSGMVEQQIESIVTMEKETPIVIYYKIRETQETTEE